MANKVWVLPLLEHTQSKYKEWMQVSNVRFDIISILQVAEDNPEHMKTLYKSCEAAGFNCDIYNSTTLLGHGNLNKIISSFLTSCGCKYLR